MGPRGGLSPFTNYLAVPLTMALMGAALVLAKLMFGR